MNLLQPELWTNCEPFGTLPNNSLGVIDPYFTIFASDHVEFNIMKYPTEGWKWNKDWTKKIFETREYGFGHIITKEQYYHGTYKLLCKLPNFRGSWPAFWMIDVTGELGIPPEIDIFEQFRKDSCLTRHKITATYHDGPTYENNHNECVAQRSCKKYDKHPCLIKFEWLPACMIWTINGKHVMTIYAKCWDRFPTKPMNLLLGHGIGDWNPQDNKLAPFIVNKLTYQPF